MDPIHPSKENRFHTLLARQLAGSIDPEEQAELELILISFPSLRLQADIFIGMWEQEKKKVSAFPETTEAYIRHLLKFRSEFLVEPMVDDPASAHKPIQSRSFGYKFKSPLVAAVVFICVALTSYLTFSRKEVNRESDQISSISTKFGNKTRVSLPDSSQVWLNSGSRLEYNSTTFNKTTREVQLVGEAYFDIAHNMNKPFIVRSGNMQVRVLGTTFNVKAYPDEQNMETSLIKGSVEITIKDRPEDKYRLRPNEKLVVSREGYAQKQQASKALPLIASGKENANIVTLKKLDYSAVERLVLETAWVENKLVFKSEKFSELARKLERWYGVQIRFRDDSRTDLAFTGVFTTETIQQALVAMQLVHSFKYTKNNNMIVIE